MTRAALHLCANCEGAPDRDGREALAAALGAEGLPVALVPTPCLNACGAPVTLALQGAGRATYLFNGVDPEADRADILATVRLYLESPGGWIGDARPCGRLRHCLLGRVPALPELDG